MQEAAERVAVSRTCSQTIGAATYPGLPPPSAAAVRAYTDSRGFGRLPRGTFLHLPIPGCELETLRLPLYTFGGVGGEWAAP